jgi:hypothetical protein
MLDGLSVRASHLRSETLASDAPPNKPPHPKEAVQDHYDRRKAPAGLGVLLGDVAGMQMVPPGPHEAKYRHVSAVNGYRVHGSVLDRRPVLSPNKPWVSDVRKIEKGWSRVVVVAEEYRAKGLARARGNDRNVDS